MTSTKSIIVLAILGVLVVFGLSMCSPKSKRLGGERVSEKTQADRDTAADSLGTITAQTQETRALVENEQAQRKRLRDEIKSEYKSINETLERTAEQARRSAEEKAIALTAELSALKKRLEQAETLARRKPAPLPVTPKTTAVELPRVVAPAKKTPPPTEYTWIKPIDQATVKRVEKTRGLIRNGGLLPTLTSAKVTNDKGNLSISAPPGLLRTGREGGGASAVNHGLRSEDTGLRKAYTIPENSTLIGAQAMTGLFGRIPVSGTIRDPLPFRVITGVENLASQGFEIPNLEGAVWRGVASGDRTLRCVVGRLISVTFMFEDGTIRTVRGSNDSPLGSLIDDHGYPCIPGTYITDAPRHIAGLATAGAAVGAAGAVADREVTRQSNYNGVTESVTGDTGNYVLGSAAEEAFGEIATLLRDRMKESFDAVIVQPGAIVALAVDTEIRIDYDPDGRRIDHLDEPHQIGDVDWLQPARPYQSGSADKKQYVWEAPANGLTDKAETVVQVKAEELQDAQ